MGSFYKIDLDKQESTLYGTIPLIKCRFFFITTSILVLCLVGVLEQHLHSAHLCERQLVSGICHDPTMHI